MKILYKHKTVLPYSLHDMRVNKIEMKENNLYLGFENGYVEWKEPYKQVKGNIMIEEVDYDYVFVQLLSTNGEYGDFEGKKLELKDFLKNYHWNCFEIVDELYGYNQVLYSGYLSLMDREDFIEMEFSIYYNGNIVYEIG